MGPTNINKRPGYKRTSSNSITTAGGNVPRATIGECEVLSQLILSIQNLEFVQDDRNVYNVKCSKRSYNSTSSNTNYANVFAIPQEVRTKCSPMGSKEQNKNRTTATTSTRSSFDSPSKESLASSQRRIYDHHKNSKKSSYFKKAQWSKPCGESFMAGVPRKSIGFCPPNIEQISKMSKAKQKFFLTQDPRMTHCLVNPELLQSKRQQTKEEEFNNLTNMVKYGQNIWDPVAKASSSEESFVCEKIDLENPLQLDFQGLDYKNTYQKDEQDQQNQRNYNRLERFMARKKIRSETKTNMNERFHQERLQVPQGYRVRDRQIQPVLDPPPTPKKLGQIIRSDEKPINREIINMEKERRKERYEELYIKNKARQDLQSENVRLQKKHDNENVGIIKANEKYEQITTHVRNLLDRTFRNDPDIRQSPSESHFKKPCRQKTMELVDGSKDDILDGNNNIKNISNSPHKTPKITSDNEDHLKIGKAGSIFKLGEESREGNARLDVESGQKCLRNANKHADLKIFDQYYNSPTKEDISAVREYRSKPLGHQYDRKRRKKIKFLRPRLRYHVKKFNLVGYRYGDSVKTIDYTKINVGRQLKSNALHNSKDYIQNHVLEKKQRFQEMKEKRLRLMGIPYKPKPLRKTTSLISKCENLSISSNSEWVPEKDFLEESTSLNDILKFSRDLKPLWRRRTNMPAPKYREPTLRQHPRRRRDYENERVPSEIFDNVVRTSALPHLYKIPIDMINQSNAQIVKKRPYTAMFESRHHHDHWNPTQQLFYVDVHYQPIVVKPEITRVKRKTKDQVEQFREANPPCKKYVEMNLTIPKWNMEELIKDHRNRKQQIDKTAKTTWKITNKCEKQEHTCRTRNTRDLDQLDYPGRKEYLEFLHDVKMSIKEKQQQTEIDNSALFEDLAEELQSIECCLTSLSSSICTNLTNDSGSYILMEGQEKIPLDFIRKSLVPFEELQRSRFRAEPIDREKEEANPFHVLPFSGQMKAQRLMTQAKDRFFTFNTRLKNDMRLRLEVPYQNMEDRMVGNTGNKHKIQVATDVDENYIKQLENRSPVKMFNYKSCSTIIKDALRLKFESLLIQGQMVQSKIYDRFNEQLWSNMHTLKLLYEKLFDKWEKREYDASMAVVYKVKDIYQETDCLKAELKCLERQLVAINMDIVFTEAKWVRCIMLQNFHYLLADQEWRLENDWIHRLPNSLYDGAATETTSTVQLENFEDSIMKRSKVNIRKRDQDDAWAIKSYYEDVYLPTRHTNLIVFPDADSFQGGLERLKTKTFILLLEMHLILAIHTELQGELDEFLGWCSEDLKAKQEYVRRKCSKLYFMKNRAEWLRRRTLTYLDKSIEASFNDEMFLKDHAIIAEVWRRVVPTNMRGSGEQLQSVDMVAMISDVVLELISKFESIPMEESRLIENSLRKRRNYLKNQSKHACHIERRVEHEMKKVVQNLEPPFKKPFRSTKLRRYRIKKPPKPVEIQDKKLSERDKFYFHAFQEDSYIG